MIWGLKRGHAGRHSDLDGHCTFRIPWCLFAFRNARVPAMALDCAPVMRSMRSRRASSRPGETISVGHDLFLLRMIALAGDVR